LLAICPLLMVVVSSQAQSAFTKGGYFTSDRPVALVTNSPPASEAVSNAAPVHGSHLELLEKGADHLWHVEIKRQWIDRHSIEESSRTTIRLESTPQALLSLVRIDVPLVDEHNDNPISPHLGDVKLRLGSRWFHAGEFAWAPLFEMTFPTAEPESLGNGKYQVAPGADFSARLWTSPEPEGGASWAIESKFTLWQVMSVAGDEATRDINYTKFEPALRTAWGDRFSFKVTPKLVLDWEQDGKTGGVIELEAGWNFSPHWRTTLTLGKGLWNTGLPTTYGGKVEIALRFNF
jgi:hypothetical protein